MEHLPSRADRSRSGRIDSRCDDCGARRRSVKTLATALELGGTRPWPTWHLVTHLAETRVGLQPRTIGPTSPNLRPVEVAARISGKRACARARRHGDSVGGGPTVTG
jgi:hypothetical protein